MTTRVTCTEIGKDLEAMGVSVPYHGYVVTELNLPCISRFHKDCLFLIILNSPYYERVPIQLGTLHIDQALELATEEELENLEQK